MSHTARTHKPPRVLMAVVALVGAVVIILIARGLNTDGRLSGETVWDGRTLITRVGPGGWFLATDGLDSEIRNAVTGQSFPIASSLWLTQILPDGGSVQSRQDRLQIVAPDGRTRADLDRADLGEGLDGLAGLVVGGEATLVGLSRTSLVVMSCWAPTPTPPREEPPDSRAVLTGVSLTDGTRTWARDTGRTCAGREVAATWTPGMEPASFLVVRESEQTHAVRIDDGTVTQSWRAAPYGRVIIQGTRAAVVTDDTVQISDLESGAAVSEMSCPRARLASPGGTSEHLYEGAAIAVGCAEGAAVLDPATWTFVPVAARLPEDRLIPEGVPALHDRFVLTRSGREVAITDALDGRQLSMVEARLAVNDPRGRLLRLTRTVDAAGGRLHADHRIVDLRTGAQIAHGTHLSPGAAVAPAGLVMLSRSGKRVSGTADQPGRDVPSHTWTVTAPDLATG